MISFPIREKRRLTALSDRNMLGRQPKAAKDMTKPVPTDLSKQNISTLFTQEMLGLEPGEKEFSDKDELLYHRIYSCIEEQSKLSEHIPSAPKVLMDLLNELEKEDTDYRRITNVIEADAVLVGEIVHVVNTPAYLTRAGEVTSLDKAVALLGINGISKIATAILLRNVANIENCRYSAQLKKLWTFCLQSAHCCQILGDQDSSFKNYLLGLMHEIGCVSIISLVIKHIPDVESENLQDLQVIRRLMQERAVWLSSLIAGEWGMPEQYLLVLNEFDRLKHGQMDSDEYEYCSDSTKILETGSLAAQCYNLMEAKTIDKETGIAFLHSLRLDSKQIDKLVTRLDLAQALVS